MTIPISYAILTRKTTFAQRLAFLNGDTTKLSSEKSRRVWYDLYVAEIQRLAIGFRNILGKEDVCVNKYSTVVGILTLWFIRNLGKHRKLVYKQAKINYQEQLRLTTYFTGVDGNCYYLNVSTIIGINAQGEFFNGFCDQTPEDIFPSVAIVSLENQIIRVSTDN